MQFVFYANSYRPLIKPCRAFNFGKVFCQCRCNRTLNTIRVGDVSIGQLLFCDDAMNTVGFAVVAVIAEFVLEIEEDQRAAREADCETDDVDEGVGFVACEVADGDGDVVFEHLRTF